MKEFLSDIGRVEKKNNIAEFEIKVEGSKFVSLDICAVNSNTSLQVSVFDLKTKKSIIILGELLIPSGGMLSLFAHKMVSNKVISLKASDTINVWYEMEDV